ncbi:hypothetical protein [Clostridium polynesiense]|uniref:hypothetical protein n=1 Tax=Clostridium polynesiense TaxID=1325933 RepID=UPI00058CA5F9|nr:hypothetical protein [Clostridium polynesiense]
MDWSNAVSHAKGELTSSPANVSINVSDSNYYNDCKIRLSSNYWSDVSWVGNTRKESSNVYEIYLNSSKVSTEDLKKSTATHEICHAFGLNDCEDSAYIMYGYDTYTPLSITNYENNLFIGRYGAYN